MTILYVEQTKADNTLKSTNISLVSCNFYNHLYNLPSDGTISDEAGNVLLRIPRGNYTIISFKSVIEKTLYIGEKQVSIEISERKAYLKPTVESELSKIIKHSNKPYTKFKKSHKYFQTF